MSLGTSRVTSTLDESTISKRSSTSSSSTSTSLNTNFTDYNLNSGDIETFLDRSFAPPPAKDPARRYWLPIDEQEVFRQKLSHILWLKQLVLVKPTIDQSTTGVALDLGTGCGFWVQDVSQRFPQLQVMGLDLHYDHEPEAPESSWFLRTDCEDETDRWPDANPVILINLRDSFWWLRDHHRLCRRGFEALQEGAWFQSQEVRISDWYSNKPRVEEWRDQVLQAASSLKLPLPSHDEMKTALLAAGFGSFHEDRRTCSSSTLAGADVIDLVKSTVWATERMVVEGGLCSLDQVYDILSGVIEELDQGDTCVEIEVCVLWAQKPVRVT